MAGIRPHAHSQMGFLTADNLVCGISVAVAAE